MASFRNGFKIFGEISLKQGLGRIRSFSEDRKPRQWLPEDQWTVRQRESTCPEPCDKPKKRKTSKSWLNICKDPEVPIECDIRHNNCPPPKPDGPWYKLDNLIPKKKHEKPPPLQTCKEEIKRRENCIQEEEVCENMVDKTFTVDIKPEYPESCMPKQEPCPAPVVALSSPLPKELDIMLWCGRPSRETSRIAVECQSDKLPYQEFRPQKSWKPPPFSLPAKAEMSHQSCCTGGPIAYAEFKQVELPKPLYTRYKSVELRNRNFLLSMTDAQCPEDNSLTHALLEPHNPSPKPILVEKKKDICSEKSYIEAGSCKPVPIKKAPKYTFRQKPTKLIEKRVFKNPCAQHKTSELIVRPPDKSDGNGSSTIKSARNCKPPEVITSTLTDEPQTFERNCPTPNKPPSWMYFLCKPGSKATPSVSPPEEPSHASETDGLKFYNGDDGVITPKFDSSVKNIASEKVVAPCPCAQPPPDAEYKERDCESKSRYVLMPEKYNIKNSRPEDPSAAKDDSKSSTFEKFVEAQAVPSKSSKSYPPMKENILYDLQRLCPNVPFDPSKLNCLCRKPPPPDCHQAPKFYRNFSTFHRITLRDLCSNQLCKIQRRTESGDTASKCSFRPVVKARECPEKPKPPDCAEISLPCCPKAKIPPKCDVRRPMPPCKKKLAPRPSFSECSKDPLPCPKITECNCWEKKPPKRKYSDWAAVKNGNFVTNTSDTIKLEEAQYGGKNPTESESF